MPDIFAESCASNGSNVIQTRYFMFSPGFLLVFLVLVVLMTEYVRHSLQNISGVYRIYQQTYPFVRRVDARPHPLPWAPRASHMWAASCKERESPMRMGQKPRLPLATADGLSEIFMLKMVTIIYYIEECSRWAERSEVGIRNSIVSDLQVVETCPNKELNMNMHYHALTIGYLIVALCWCALGIQMLKAYLRVSAHDPPNDSTMQWKDYEK